MQVLFVCTGNTCRSPMAAALLRKKTNVHTVSSAGLSVLCPSPASENAIAVMASEYGIDISSHRSCMMTDKMAAEADLILTMTDMHKQMVKALFPTAKNKVYTLCEYAGHSGDVTDPFGGDLSTYAACAHMLAQLIEEAPL